MKLRKTETFGPFRSLIRKKVRSVKQAGTLEWSSDASSVSPKNDEDVALARRCGSGDQAACQQLVDEYQRMVYALGCQLLADHDEALDLSQEVFLRVFRTIGRFQGRAALRTWIYRIVINGARNRRRWYQRRRRAYLVPLDVHISEHGELPAPKMLASPDEALDRKENEQRLWRAMAELPLDQRTALILRELHGLRYKEIAFSLGVTTSAVKSRLARARESLRRELKSA